MLFGMLLRFSKQTTFVFPWSLDREGDAYLSKVFIDPILLVPDILCVYPCTAYWLLGIVVFPLCQDVGRGESKCRLLNSFFNEELEVEQHSWIF